LGLSRSVSILILSLEAAWNTDASGEERLLERLLTPLRRRKNRGF
jgi:hypothetical protein